jgi:hypothetical protein
MKVGPGPRGRPQKGWAAQIESSLPLYGLQGRQGQAVWTERRRTGNRRGIEYSDGTATLQVITSALPGPEPRSFLPDTDRPVAVEVIVSNKTVILHGVAAGDGKWAARADLQPDRCITVVNSGWAASALALAPVES